MRVETHVAVHCQLCLCHDRQLTTIDLEVVGSVLASLSVEAWRYFSNNFFIHSPAIESHSCGTCATN